MEQVYLDSKVKVLITKINKIIIINTYKIKVRTKINSLINFKAYLLVLQATKFNININNKIRYPISQMIILINWKNKLHIKNRIIILIYMIQI